jgi:LPXTG-motif cell wall-anchored protein
MKSCIRFVLTLCLVTTLLLSVVLPASAAGIMSPATGDSNSSVIFIIVGILVVALVLAVIFLGKKKDRYDE